MKTIFNPENAFAVDAPVESSLSRNFKDYRCQS